MPNVMDKLEIALGDYPSEDEPFTAMLATDRPAIIDLLGEVKSLHEDNGCFEITMPCGYSQVFRRDSDIPLEDLSCPCEQKGHYLDDVISNAINSSWKDFYEPKNQNQQQHKSFAQQHSDEVSNMVDTVIDNNFDPFDPRNYPQQEEIIDVQPTKRIS